MKKRALRKDFYMEIRKTLSRFLSILMIVALGVAFYSGIQSAAPDMRYSGDAYFDEQKLMDLKVIGTMGLTDGDVRALEAIDGISGAEPGYMTDVLCGEETQEAIHLESISPTLNRLTPAQGRLPEASGECFLDIEFFNASGYAIGDSITFYGEDEDSFVLKQNTFTIVGAGSSPLYISFGRGNTTLGNGELSGVGYLLAEDFDLDVYTQIYLEVQGARGLTAYTEEYDSLISRVQERIEEIAGARCEARYGEVMDEVQEKLADAKKELADGKTEGESELADAREELTDALRELNDGKKEMSESAAALAQARQQWEDGRRELEENEETIRKSEQELADAKAQLADGQTQLAEGKQTLAANEQTFRSEYEKAIGEIEAGEKQLKQAKKELKAGKKEYENGLVQYSEGMDAYTGGERQYEQGLADYQQQADAWPGQKKELEAQRTGLVSSQEALEKALPEMEAQLLALQQQKEEAQAALDAGMPQADALLAQIEAGITALQSEYGTQTENLEAVKAGIAKIDAGIAQGDEGLKTAKEQLDATRDQLNLAKMELVASFGKLQEAEAGITSGEQEIQENEQKLADGRAALEDGRRELEKARQTIAQNEQQLASAQQELADGESQLEDGKKQLAEGRQELNDAKKEILDGRREWIRGVQEYRDGKQKYADGLQEYKDGVKEFEDKIADGEAKIADAEEEAADLKMPEWIVNDRSALPENVGYGENADRMRSLGQVFPALFFLVAALISLTTMTRMVEEERTQIGTLKALGYGKFSIASKYVCYALIATLAGSAAGIAFGEKFLPFVIITAYHIMYHHMPNLALPYNMEFAVAATGAALFSTMAGTLAACFKELAATPAILMRPPAPKEGKRVLLEYLPFLWKPLSFSWKSTVRNLFRYKKRFFMTIFGISGCMALMLVGYGLRDSILDVASLQFHDLQIYDGMLILDSEASESEKDELMEAVASDSRIENAVHTLMRSDTVRNGKKSWELYVMVPEDAGAFADFIKYRDRETGETYELTDAGAILTEKIADMMGVKAGDTITVETDENAAVEIPVAAVTENYLRHYIYLTPALYEQCFGEKPEYGTVLYRMKEDQKELAGVLGEEFLTYDAALSVNYTGTIMAQLDDMLSALDAVMIVLIVSAGLLAFVVLYNLNNININERKRELATIKVLGFYDGEVSAYVYRENILLTLIGIAAGAGLGVILHRFTITTVEVDACMFGRNIKPVSFLISAAFTAGFSLFVNVVMHFKLKKIDMVESLKSVE